MSRVLAVDLDHRDLQLLEKRAYSALDVPSDAPRLRLPVCEHAASVRRRVRGRAVIGSRI
jgi:hypothetical protein